MLFFLSRASISAKLAASSLAFALPIAVLTLFLVRGLDKDIDFAKQEMLGNAALRPMVRLLVHLPDGASGRSQAQTDFSALAEVTARAAEPLEFTPAGLARRGRESLAPAAVESRWRRLGDSPSAADQDALVAGVRGMISHAGDTSNLILDPDLDSYYLMDVVLLALPQTLDRTASAVREALAFARAAETSQAGHNALAVNAAMLREADLERVRTSLDTALKEDPLFYGRSASLHSAVPPKAQAYYQAAGALISLLERMAAGDKPSEAEIAAAGNRARQAGLELWETVSAELDKLLATRIEHYQGRMVWALGLSMAALAVAGFVVFLIARGILAQLGGIREYARKVAAGDLKAAPCARCRGELKELSDDIQAMVGDLRDRLGYTLSLQNSFKVPLLVADVDAKVTYTNQELLNFIEVEGRPEDWIGLTVAQLVRNDAQQDTVMSKCLRENRCVYKAEITFITRRDNIRHALVDSELLTDLDGNITGVVGVLSDVTDMKRHESELERRNNALALAAGSSQEITVSLGEAVRRLAGCIAQAADGATHQNERASDTVEAMTAMNASAQQVADLAGEAALSADEAKGTASEGADMVRTAVDSIAAVRAQVLELQDKMRELGSQADNVGKVLQVIGDIADQTNLLALNAAIEAARAGDAGRGFAVVADEVRKLAEKTMQATHEVGSTLDAIRGGAAQTLKATEQAAREIVESTRLAESSGEYLGRIVSIVQGSSEQAKAIALAAGDQARASAQVNRAVAEIEGVSSRTAQGMEEASHALEEVSRQAQSLEELIRGMKD